MKLAGIELRRIRMPLVSPFRTSFGTATERDVLLLRAVTDEAEGWGECVAMSDPLYSSEYVEAAADVLRRYLEDAEQVPARELTSAALVRSLPAHLADGGLRGHCRELLGEADLVKFARVRPSVTTQHVRSVAGDPQREAWTNVAPELLQQSRIRRIRREAYFHAPT